MKKLITALKAYKKMGVIGIKNRMYAWIINYLGIILPAQTESRRAKDAAQYWSESERSQQIRDLSHWSGEGQWGDSNAWTSIGESHFQMWKQFSKNYCNKQASKRMVEWGPGGGANAVVFAQTFENFYGVEISKANLDECKKQFKKRKLKGFIPILIDAEDPKGALSQINEPCDFFLSTAVFQHFPSKDYGVEVLGVANSMLRSGGIALIQIRYDDLSLKFKPKNRNYKTHAVTFTSYKLHEFWKLTLDKGFSPHFIELRPSVNYAYFYLCKNS